MLLPRTVVVAVLIYLIVLIPVLASSGAPVRVEAVDALALGFGFLFPALFLRGTADFKKRFWLLVPWAAIAVLTFDILSAMVIVKRDIFWGWQALYPGGILFLLGLLVLHSWVLDRWASRATARGVA